MQLNIFTFFWCIRYGGSFLQFCFDEGAFFEGIFFLGCLCQLSLLFCRSWRQLYRELCLIRGSLFQGSFFRGCLCRWSLLFCRSWRRLYRGLCTPLGHTWRPFFWWSSSVFVGNWNRHEVSLAMDSALVFFNLTYHILLTRVMFFIKVEAVCHFPLLILWFPITVVTN